MSVNLYSKEVYLWQTPTWLTNVALYDHKGKTRHWKDTRNIYLEWVKTTTTGVWDDPDALRYQSEIVKQHIEEIMACKKIKWCAI